MASTQVDQHLVELFLAHQRMAGSPADVDPLGSGRQIEQLDRRQPVVHHDISSRKQVGTTSSDESGVSRSRADEVDGHGAEATASAQTRADCVKIRRWRDLGRPEVPFARHEGVW